MQDTIAQSLWHSDILSDSPFPRFRQNIHALRCQSGMWLNEKKNYHAASGDASQYPSFARARVGVHLGCGMPTAPQTHVPSVAWRAQSSWAVAWDMRQRAIGQSEIRLLNVSHFNGRHRRDVDVGALRVVPKSWKTRSILTELVNKTTNARALLDASWLYDPLINHKTSPKLCIVWSPAEGERGFRAFIKNTQVYR